MLLTSISNLSCLIFLIINILTYGIDIYITSNTTNNSFYDKYAQYLIEFRKSSTRLNDINRLNQFTKSYSFIETHNNLQGNTFFLRMNEISDMFDDEIKNLFDRSNLIQYSSSDDKKDGPIMSSKYISENIHENEPEQQLVLQHLNWASSDNPLKSSVVSSVRNQGSCGACWAFSSVNAAESSIRIALSQYNWYTGKAIIPSIPSLSVQQLLDCDTAFNKGCSGGSPLVAFQYIANNGLIPWSDYPYEEKSSSYCPLDYSHNNNLANSNKRGQSGLRSTAKLASRYYIDTYSKLNINDPDAIIRGLNKGPVTAAICGTDQYFQYYSSGIFDSDSCCLDQNHAVTIVGYSTDKLTGYDYWIVQNSWGVTWGEEGFIRIRRNPGPGVCGIQRYPMTCYGGYVRDVDGHFTDPSPFPINNNNNSSNNTTDNQYFHKILLFCAFFFMLAGLFACIWGIFYERIIYITSTLRASQNGYQSIEQQ